MTFDQVWRIIEDRGTSLEDMTLSTTMQPMREETGTVPSEPTGESAQLYPTLTDLTPATQDNDNNAASTNV